jgi:hypothetical protein
MPVPSDDKLIELLLAARDEHMRRLHAINRQVALLVLTLSVTLFIGAILGIDALAAVDVTLEAAARLLSIGTWAFAGSAALISLALIHHTGDRSAAATHIESAVARLISGDERELVLADLGKSMAPLLHHSRASRPGSYLATELNHRWLGLSLYEKTFVGCALLLVASLAIGLGVITGYAPEPAEDADADFTAALHKAQENVKTAAGAQYDQAFGKSFGDRLQGTIARCGGLRASDMGTFDIVARVGSGGKLQKVLVDPSTKFAECVRQTIADDEYPAPPQPSYWVNVHVSFRE